MLFCTLQFMFVLFVAPRYGIISNWLRKKRMVPQELREDLLVSILRKKGEPISIQVLKDFIHIHKNLVPRAARLLAREKLIKTTNNRFILTARGEEEAMKVLRAHRLWESYLQSVGAPSEDIHSVAHHLEHLEYEKSIEYLDSKLGHPRTGPHGEYIPGEAEKIDTISAIHLSQLKTGETAKVVSTPQDKTSYQLKNGDVFTVEGKTKKGIIIARGRRKILIPIKSSDKISVVNKTKIKHVKDSEK